MGNRFGSAFGRLPVAAADPVDRPLEAKAAMHRVKTTGEGLVVAGALSVMGQTPAEVQRRWLDLFAGRAGAVVTNVAGSREPATLAGVPLRGFVGWVPSTGPVGVGLTICGYAGEDLVLGVAVDEAVVRDDDALLDALGAELAAPTGAEAGA